MRSTRVISLIGQRFGRLKVISFAGHNTSKKRTWNCRCDCGVTKPISTQHLRKGSVSSCGCLAIEKLRTRNTTHGKAYTSEWFSWVGIRKRCLNPKDKAYHYYGGRGIKICDRWIESFENFLADMGKKPGPEFSIERIDNDGNYEPSNCKWATSLEQMNNRRGNVPITFNGKTQNMSQWAKELGFYSSRTISYRVKELNWSIEKTMTTPSRARIKGKAGPCAQT